jgi:site-specific recombinase XerD
MHFYRKQPLWKPFMSDKTDKTLKKKKIPLNNDSWDEIIAAFESDLYRRNKSEVTIRTYRSCLNVFCRFYKEQLQKPGPYVQRLQETDFVTYIDYLRHDRKLSASSMNRHIAALKSFSKFIFYKRLQRRLLSNNLKTYRIQQQKEPSRLSKQEVRRLLTAVDLNGRNGYRNLAILQLFLQCGLRVGELVRLSRDDITLHKTTGSLKAKDEKGISEREIPLNKSVRKALQDYLDERGPIAGLDPMFISERQCRMSVPAVQHMIKRVLCLAGREDLSAHHLRHHFAFEFYSKSKKLTATQQVLGHSNINTTARYARATTMEIQETIDAMDS